MGKIIGVLGKSQKAGITILSLLTAYILFAVLRAYPNNAGTGMKTHIRSPDSLSVSRHRISQDFPGVRATLTLEILLDENSILAPGDKHYASVAIRDKTCLSPSFSVWLTGEALIAINFVESIDRQQSLWIGEFLIPVKGTYAVELKWFGCSIQDDRDFFHAELMKLNITGSPVEVITDDKTIFAEASWLSKNLFPNIAGDGRFADYVWIDPKAIDVGEIIHLDSSNVSIAKKGAFADHGMYKFNELGNYEIVCFWGGETMQKIREFFLQEKKILSWGQRPFKFHFYNVTQFQNPDRNWERSDKERCRKCKHIFLSVDDMEPLSQIEFEDKFLTFVQHLMRLMDDPTFPIWVLSEIRTNQMNRGNTCHEPYKYPRSSDNPCNEVLKALLHQHNNRFGKRVHFLDNTNLVLPTLQSDVTTDTVLANIALRIFVAVGKGVSEWRRVHQYGKVDGLHRNGTIEPNFKLIPYDWSVPPPLVPVPV